VVVTRRVYEANVLFGVAVNSAASIQAPTRAGGQLHALVSLVFSVIAVEAFLNEATGMAVRFSKYAGESQVVPVFAERMADAEKAHESLESKLALAYKILGKKLDKSAPPYRDFALMVRLRNRLVHFKGNEGFDPKATAQEFHKDLIQRFGRNKKPLAGNMEPGSWIHADRDQSYRGLVLQHCCSDRHRVCFQSSSRCVVVIFGRHSQALQTDPL